jgi:2'-5' RNA ligase
VDASSPWWRLFVALPVPTPVKAGIEALQRDLRRRFPHGAVRWASPAQFHLTLRFLGEVDSARVPELIFVLEPVAREIPPLALRAAGLGGFPDLKRPRVLWVGLDETSGRLAKLWNSVQSVTLPYTQENREEHFAAHITIGRVKVSGARESAYLREMAPGMAARPFGHWTASQMELMRSKLGPQGAVHECLHCFAFAAGR